MTSNDWRADTDTHSWFDLVKRMVMVGSFCIPAVYTWYHLKRKRQDLAESQRLGLTLCGITYAGQVALKLFYVQRNRPVPLEEAMGFLFVAAPTFYGLPLYFAKPAMGKNIKMRYVIGTMSYLLGMWILIKSEYDRKVFKSDSGNKGKLYMDGWNAWSRNPNYFGELLIFAGWNMFTFNDALTVLETLAIALSFYAMHIPGKEEYLSGKYVEWPEYSKRVKALIPFIC